MKIDSFGAEVEFLYEIVSRWWANRDIHHGIDGIDVGAVFRRLHRRVHVTTDLVNYALALRDEISQLGDGHLRLGRTMHRSERRYRSGLAFKKVYEGIALLWAADTYRSFSGHAVCPGDLVVTIDGTSSETYLESFRLLPGSTPRHRLATAVSALSCQERLFDETPSPVDIRLTKPNGDSYSLSLQWTACTPPGPTSECVKARRISEHIGLITIRTFYCRDELGQVSDLAFLRQMQAAVEKLRHTSDIIVDLRNNAGGRDEQAQIAAKHLTCKSMPWFCYQHQTPLAKADKVITTKLEREPDQSHRPLDANLFFLVDSGCYSTTEILLAAFRQLYEVTLIGQPTGGGAGNPQTFRLPFSGLAIDIPSSRYYRPDGQHTPIEGRGLEPDILIETSVSDLIEQRDPVLDRAIAEIDMRS